MLTIGQLAKATDNNTVTIRYYEKCGLIPASKRSQAGYRLYSETLIPRFRFIKNAKIVGFSLDEIKKLLLLQDMPYGISRQIKDIMESKITEIKEKIKVLKKMQQTLEHLSQSCQGQKPIQECPILEGLYTRNKAELKNTLSSKSKEKS